MKLLLLRDHKTDKFTFGKLFVNGEYECETLEDPIRDVKIKGETAIPAGTYKVIISYSPRFGIQMPLLLNVPGFQGIRIHSGNFVSSTEGCILVGTKRGKIEAQDAILNSRSAYKKLFTRLSIASKTEEIIITVE